MAYTGTATAGKVYIGSGVGQGGRYASIGTDSGLTNNGVVVAQNTGAFVATAAGTNGQVLIGGNASAPAFGTIGSTDGSIGFTSGTNSLNMTVNATATFPLCTTPYAVVCGGSSTAAVFQQVTGLGSSGAVLQSAGAGVKPAWTTATYPATTTANQLLYSSAANTVAGLTNGTTGQVLTATTGAAPSWAAASSGFWAGPQPNTSSTTYRLTAYCPTNQTILNTLGLVDNRLYWYPLVVQTTLTVSSMTIKVVTNVAGSTARLGIYNSSADLATTLAVDAGTVSLAAAGEVSASVNVTLSPGLYYLALTCDTNGGAPTVIQSGVTSLSSVTYVSGGTWIAYSFAIKSAVDPVNPLPSSPTPDAFGGTGSFPLILLTVTR